jgi:hypothetical protein
MRFAKAASIVGLKVFKQCHKVSDTKLQFQRERDFIASTNSVIAAEISSSRFGR